MLRIAFDTETTGLERGSRMVELAAVLFDDEDGSVKSSREWLVNPGMPIPPGTSKIHHITDDMVIDAPNAKTVLEQFFGWAPEDVPLMAHNASYDTGIISWDAARLGVPIDTQRLVTCTLEISKKIAATKSNKLAALVKHYDINTEGDAHRALHDAQNCRKYFQLVKGEHNVEPCPWAFAGHDYTYSDELPDAFADLPDCVANGIPIDFAYIDGNDNSTERTLLPCGWYAKDGQQYVQGWCYLREARRTFRMDRIQSVAVAA